VYHQLYNMYELCTLMMHRDGAKKYFNVRASSEKFDVSQRASYVFGPPQQRTSRAIRNSISIFQAGRQREVEVNCTQQKNKRAANERSQVEESTDKEEK
jgi:hypothetical protein